MSEPPTTGAMNREEMGDMQDAGAATRVLAGVCVALFVVALRCVSLHDPMPWWSSDPFVAPASLVGIGPALSAWLDVAVCVGACVAWSGMRAHERGRFAVACGAALAAAMVVAMHVVLSLGTVEDMLLGLQWASAIVGGGLLFACAGRGRVRTLAVCVLVAVVGALAVRAASEVTVEHARRVADYRLTKDQFLQSQGWSADSPMARAFERRLMQAEASGYFSLANPLATVGASACGVCACLLIGVWLDRGASARTTREARRGVGPWAVVVLVGGTLACAGVVAMAGAKGGYAALALGLVLCAWVGMRAVRGVGRGLGRGEMSVRVARLLGPVIVAGVLLAVVARGVVGERIGELSVLFRWFYMRAASRIFMEHPLLGVGPGGFKEAYVGAKVAISPEEVSSPHSLLFDWAACLGVGGLALCVLFAWWVSLAGVRVVRGELGAELGTSDDEIAASLDGQGGAIARSPGMTGARLGRVAGVVFALACAGAIALEREVAEPLSAVVRLAGVAVGAVLASAVARLVHREVRERGAARDFVPAAVGVGALVAAAHCQIELTGVTPGAGAWCLALIGLAAGCGAGGREKEPAHSPARGGVRALQASVQASVLTATLALCVLGAWRLWAWQHALSIAHAPVAEISELLARRNALAAGRVGVGLAGDTPAILAQDIEKYLKSGGGSASAVRVEATPAAIDHALAIVKEAAARGAIAQLDRAVGITNSSHTPTLRAASRARLTQAEGMLQGGALPESAGVVECLESGAAMLARGPTSNTLEAWTGSYFEAAHTLGVRTLQGVPTLEAAQGAWVRTCELAPYELVPAVRAADVASLRGDGELAATWAAEALRRNELLRLDPLEQLQAREVARLKALVEAVRKQP